MWSFSSLTDRFKALIAHFKAMYYEIYLKYSITKYFFLWVFVIVFKYFIWLLK